MISNDSKIVATKSLLVGWSAYYLANQLGFSQSAVRMGLGAASMNVLTFLFTDKLNRESWITPKQPLPQTWQAIRSQVGQIARSQLIWGALVLVGGQGLNQNAIRYLNRALSRGLLDSVRALGSVCLFGPLAETIFFQGFVQEKIQELQLKVRGASGDPQGEQRMRVLLQAMLFGLAHYSGPQKGSNPFIILATGTMGLALGQLKEDYGIHAPFALHVAANALVSARTIVVGG